MNSFLKGFIKRAGLADAIKSISLKQVGGPSRRFGVTTKTLNTAYGLPGAKDIVKLPPSKPAAVITTGQRPTIKMGGLAESIKAISLKQISGRGSKVGSLPKDINKAYNVAKQMPAAKEIVKLPSSDVAQAAADRAKGIKDVVTPGYQWRSALREPVKP
jgi:hypothetical protein